MKKIYIPALILSLFTVSCSSDNDTATGSISLNPATNIETDGVETRATSLDYKTYSVILDGPGGRRTIPFPASGQIDDVRTGAYTVTVTSHPETFNPAFDEQVYSGSATVNVAEDETATATIECTQANAGVKFVYDNSLAENGFTDLVPTVTMGSQSLVYSGANREATGYFNPGTATVTLKNGENNMNLDDESKAQLELKAKQLVNVTLTAVPTRAGAGSEVVITVSAQ